MRLLIDASFTTLPLTEALSGGFADPGIETALRPALKASDVLADDAAFVSVGEYGALRETHRIVPGLAIVFDRRGAVTLRTPVRPDEVEQTVVRFLETSSGAELLTRATLDPFFGITPAGYEHQDVDDAQAVVVEGALALTPPEVGFSEDLARAWFILTSEPYVSHILLAPVESDAEAKASLVAAATTLRNALVEHRRPIRGRIVTATNLEREALTELYQATRWKLESTDRRALLMLLQLGNRRGEVGPYVSELAFLDE